MTLSDLQPGEHFTKLLQKRWLVWLVNGLLLMWLAWVAGTAILDYSEPPLEPVVITPPVAAPATTATEPVTAIDIADWHLFGEASDADTPDIKHALEAPETQLKLSLMGIVATDDSKLGYAIIQKPDKEELHFKVKDSVFGMATLEEIYIDRVILLRDGRYETLRLPIEFMATDLVQEAARKKEAKRIVTDFRQKLINRDGMALIRMFGFEETYRNGGFVGFTVKIAGEDGARLLETLGVEEGDVITAVNDKRFSESIEAVNSLTKLKDATEVNIEIDRHGIPMFFHFEFADLEAATEKTGGDDAVESTADTEATPARQTTTKAPETQP